MNLERKQLSIASLSSITTSYTRFDAKGWATDLHYPPPQILVIACSGEYEYGSAGHGDAMYMRAMIESGIAAFRPLSLILDLAKLKYEWGDDIDYALFASLDDGPEPLIVIGPECHDGLKSLMVDSKSGDGLIDNKEYFGSLDDAIAYLHPKLDLASQ